MKHWALLLALGLCCNQAFSQALQLSFPRLNAAPEEVVTLPLTVADFDSIVTLQFSIRWNPDVITYQGHEPGDLEAVAIGEAQSADGELRLSWFPPSGKPESLPDGGAVVRFRFRADGAPGDSTLIYITDQPLAIQIVQATPIEGEFEPIPLEQDTGLVRIQAPLGFQIDQANVSCFGRNDGSLSASLAVDTMDYSIEWTGPDGFSADTYQLSGLAGGEYRALIRDGNGQVVFEYTTTIVAPDAPLILDSLTATAPDCNENNGSVRAVATGGTAPYTYRLGDREQQDGQFDNLPAGRYLLEVVDNNGCIASDSLALTAPGMPEISLPDTLGICGEGESITLDPGGMGTYQWSTGESTATITVNAPGTYSVTVTGEGGCEASESTLVLATGDLEAMLETDVLDVCPGDSLQLRVSGGDRYEWIAPPGVLTATDIPDPVATPDSSVTLQAIVSNACASDTLTLPLFVYDITATAGPDTCVAPGDPAFLRASGGLFYTWQNNGLSDPNSPTPTVTPEDSTTYVVTIVDINGCTTVDSVLVLVANDPLSTIRPINLITPNGDGKNDMLEFEGIDKYGSNSLKIYNRWGDLIYQRINYQRDEERFTGDYNGKPLPPGNYFYVLEFRTGTIKQTLTIVRE